MFILCSPVTDRASNNSIIDLMCSCDDSPSEVCDANPTSWPMLPNGPYERGSMADSHQ